MNVAIITARGGAQSIPRKNLLEIGGRPLVSYPVRAAKMANRVNKTYIATDDDWIASASVGTGADGVIWRPKALQGPNVNHGFVIRHAVYEARELHDDLENVVVLLGNTVMVTPGLIDEALEMLDAHPHIDSVMSVWEAQDDHPYRALELTDAGTLKAFGDTSPVHTNRQSYPKVYFYDQGVWAFRWQCIQKEGSIRPWWWMGNVCMPIVRPWIAGRDIHSALDIWVAEKWAEDR